MAPGTASAPGEEQQTAGCHLGGQHWPEPLTVARLQGIHHVDHDHGLNRFVQVHAQRIAGEHGYALQQLRVRAQPGQQHRTHTG